MAATNDDILVVGRKEWQWAEPSARRHGPSFHIHHKNVVAPYCFRRTGLRRALRQLPPETGPAARL